MGGGGSGPPGYVAYYDPGYENPPKDYGGQNEINEASKSIIDRSDGTIRQRIIPNMIQLDATNTINRLHLQATDQVNDQTNYFINTYPQNVLNQIIAIEEAYQRINDYLKFFATFDTAAFKVTLENHRKWFEKTRNELCDFLRQADYYKNRIQIKRTIENAIVAKRRDYIQKCSSSIPEEIPFELKIPDDISKEEFRMSYISELGDDTDPNSRRIYLNMGPPQTGMV